MKSMPVKVYVNKQKGDVPNTEKLFYTNAPTIFIDDTFDHI